MGFLKKPLTIKIIPDKSSLSATNVASAGQASIEAVLNPEDTNFLFFVANGTGGHIFAETLNQHNANVKKWRAIEAGKAKK